MTENVTKSIGVHTDPRKLKIGIPRALYFYRYGALWKSFLTELGCQVVISPPTTMETVEQGSKVAMSELCIPMKIYFGHVLELIKEYPDLDYLFIPRYVSSHREQFFCPKFLILPETIKYCVSPEISILTLEINVKKRPETDGAIQIGKILGITNDKCVEAWIQAKMKYENFRQQAKGQNYLDRIDQLDENPKHQRKPKYFHSEIASDLRGKFPLSIGILGHAYNVYETQINIDLIARLTQMDCNVKTIESMPPEIFDRTITINNQYHQYWQSEDEILKTARYFLNSGRSGIDGIIFLISFACGPDSLIQELVMRDMKARNIPFLALILDEHSGESGLITRIESFIDMIRREKYNTKKTSGGDG